MTDPYRHQELQFEYYEPARMHRPMMSKWIWLAVFVALVSLPVALNLYTYYLAALKMLPS